jgi:hypothetical protein
MVIRNQAWYNYCESVPYPVEDTVSRVSDAGTRLPGNVISDLNLRYPSTLGSHVFVAACTVNPQLVTVVLLGSSSATAAVDVTPIASVSLRQPVDVHRPYALSPLAEGVGGWVVFGNGIAGSYQGRFASPSQTRISPRAARAYAPLPVVDFGKLGNTQALTGLVSLVAGNDLEIVKATRSVNEQDISVIVIRLSEGGNLAVARNLYDVYRGPCGTRPESDTCGDPAPIEFLNTVPPDKQGNINIEFQGALSLTAIAAEAVYDAEGNWIDSTEACGVIVDLATGLATACGEDRQLPDVDGRLPNEGDEDCSFVSISISY